ncbi:hypothetical protein H257_02326 [Aphanomyces astaci]|uniref:Uncharacterized protein n=1 Tax=Aphanomyces astaci TaxID=112090 RepID=W4H3K3_APHAT|nr:hypothetical protein H257_02326 [Aphanomyces astaci]ETV85733.1 hypothetical protein H257_02326 [Aphanomyces astaci]|eukprot:XP_009824205.1 hypothetical protein H257_02326 [Aphanomyces astaci]
MKAHSQHKLVMVPRLQEAKQVFPAVSDSHRARYSRRQCNGTGPVRGSCCLGGHDNNIDVIYNADQTGVNYEYLPTKRLNSMKNHVIWIKCSGKIKDRATVMVMADPTGKPFSIVSGVEDQGIKDQVRRAGEPGATLGITADVPWIRPMKARLRQKWMDSVRRQVLRSKAKKETFQLQAPKRPTLVQWITESRSGLD